VHEEFIMGITEPVPSEQFPRAARPRNGLGVAALVIGVASLVAGISFVLFPLALLGGLVGLVIGIVALARRNKRGVTNSGPAIAGVVCCVIALAIGIDLSVHVGTWAARNTSVLTRFDKCIAQAGNRSQVADCIARLANQVRP
jgi:membrane-bound ClpP family serine protease